MKITFKDVGQGDSILLEWTLDGIPKIGIIDCNKKGSINPVLDHLKSKQYSEIEFAVLSHPHRDHYSGFYEVFDYCLNNNIPVKRFMQTAHYIGNKYWKYFEIDTASSELLFKLVHKSKELDQHGLLTFVDLTYDYRIRLSEQYELECIAPYQSEIQKFQEVMNFDPERNKKKASSAANFLSTVFCLKFGGNFLLLTSDAEKDVFNRIMNRDSEKFMDKTLILSQAPHHGSKNNFEESFWIELNKEEGTPVITSAGVHGHYHHPDIETLDGFHKNGFTVHSTNIINGMAEFVNKMRDVSMKLDAISSVVEEYWHGGDKVFECSNLISQPLD